MRTANFITWRGLQIPKISKGARIDIIAPRVPYYCHVIPENGVRIYFPKGLVALSQIVLGPHYQVYPVDPSDGVLFENFEPVIIVAHCPPPGLANLEDTKLPPQCDLPQWDDPYPGPDGD